MCGRFSLSKSASELLERFEAIFDEPDDFDFGPFYNAAPSQHLPVLRQNGQLHFTPMHWGLVPFWAKDKKIGYRMINARSETLTEKPAFRNLVQRQRCIIPAEGYYEWHKTAGDKIPNFIYLKDGGLFGMAGLWSTWNNPEGGTLESFTIITCPANPEVTHLHDRMPVILPRHLEKTWLDPGLSPGETKELLQSYPGSEMDYHPVSKAVNTPRNNDPRLHDRVDHPGDLFS